MLTRVPVVLTLALVWLSPALARAQVAAPPQAQEAPAVAAAAIDKIFERWDRNSSAGCAVGVSQGGQVVHARGYGMANLEHGIRIWPTTVFESGSVAKQFTAAAIALLAQDGRLSIDDPVRKYIPELPDFGPPILIRHLLNHTSGLRSQWPMLTLAGRPPGSAVHTVAEILELVSHYEELNFKPGEEFLYNNTAFTLLGVIVQRVAGKSLNEFSRERIFGPLGMTRTEWREDFAAVVPNRATAYRLMPDGRFRANMPFTNVIGNGGLLTTVGDLLVWNENFDRPRVGGKDLADRLQTRGRLNDGFENEYAQGLYVTQYRGTREVSHGGSTAGYQTFLARFPDHGLSVAVLCNTNGTNPSRYAHEIADLMLAGKLKNLPVVRSVAVPPEVLERLAGVYREAATDAVLRLVWDAKGGVVRAGGQPLVPTGPGELYTMDGARRFSTARGWPDTVAVGSLAESSEGDRPRRWDLQAPFRPDAARLAEFAGDYTSTELGVTYTVLVEEGALQVRFRPAQRYTLQPVFTDAFVGDGNTIRFTRSPGGAVDGLRIYAGRARHVRFARQPLTRSQ
jgi:CubicO group peptidase (beta-lactamase class C family)